MTGNLQPAFFSAGALFGCMHAPAARNTRTGVLFCYPAFGEYIQQHRAYVQLATLLADRGITSLRFDYFGTGDSAGDLADATLARWRDDIASAARFLCRDDGIESLVVIGSRLGATLAAFATLDDPMIDGVVLWEPVVDGAQYLADLCTAHVENLLRYDVAAGHLRANGHHDVLGFEIPHALWTEMSSLRLSDAALSPAVDVLIVDDPLRHATIHESLGPNLTRIWFETSVRPAGWLAPEDGIYDVLTPQQTLASIMRWVMARMR